MKEGDRVRLTQEGIRRLGHVKLMYFMGKKHYDNTLRGTLKGFEKNGNLIIELDGWKKRRPYNKDYWELDVKGD